MRQSQPVHKLPESDLNPAYVNYWIDRIMALGKRHWIPIEKPAKFRLNIKGQVLNPAIDEPDLEGYWKSNEVPANMAFVAQGSDYENEYLDCSQEGRYLREYCVQRSSGAHGANHFLHFRSLVDLRSRAQHQDPEYLADKLEIEYDLAFQLVDVIRRLEFDRKWYLKLYHGYGSTIGLKDMEHDQVVETIKLLIESADQADEVTVTWNNYINSNDIDRDLLQEEMQLLHRRFDPVNLDDEENTFETDQLDEMLTDDKMDRKNSDNPYSSNRLSNGKDALTPEFQAYVENADIDTIKKLQGKAFTQKRTQVEINQIKAEFLRKYGTTPYASSTNIKMKPLWKKCPEDLKSHLFRYEKPVYDDHGQLVMVPAITTGLKYKQPDFFYFTSAMKSHFWRLIKARKEVLNKRTIPMAELSDSAKLVMHWVKQLGKGQKTCALIYAAMNGKSYSLYGLKIDFPERLGGFEVNTVWKTYKAL
jgi:hypothetical protein